MLSLDRLYAEETPESIENSFDVECQESLETKISPCLHRSLIQIIHRLSISAERRVERELVASFKRVNRKEALLLKIATASLKQPEGAVKDVVYPVADPETLQALVDEQTAGQTYQEKVHTRIRASYLHHYRRMVPAILGALSFHSNNEQHQPVIHALAILKRYQDSTRRFYDSDEDLVIEGVLPTNWPELVGETDSDGEIRINRVNYEICVLQALREKLRARAIWVAGAGRYGNPEQDLPQDFEAHREVYYQELSQPLEAEAFIQQLKQTMQTELTKLDQGMPKNKGVRIQTRNYFFLRRSLGDAYLGTLQFFLNHRCFVRSMKPERLKKSPKQLMTGEAHPHWLELLGFERFHKA